MPGSMLDNMPNFQKGEILALQKFAIELRDQIGRARGTSSADPDLQDAASSLSNNADIWIFDLSRSWMPRTSSESYYGSAMKSLNSYNARLASQTIIFEPRADNLISTLDRIGKGPGRRLGGNRRQRSTRCRAPGSVGRRRQVLSDQGKIYAYSLLLLHALGQDFSDVLKDKAANKAWDRMVSSLGEAPACVPDRYQWPARCDGAAQSPGRGRLLPVARPRPARRARGHPAEVGLRRRPAIGL